MVHQLFPAESHKTSEKKEEQNHNSKNLSCKITSHRKNWFSGVLSCLCSINEPLTSHQAKYGIHLTFYSSRYSCIWGRGEQRQYMPADITPVEMIMYLCQIYHVTHSPVCGGKVWCRSGRRRWRSFLSWHLEAKNKPFIHWRGLVRSMNTGTNIVCSQIQLGGFFLCVALLAVDKQFLILFLQLLCSSSPPLTDGVHLCWCICCLSTGGKGMGSC